MADFKWLRNPTLSNGKTTWYVSHRGNDTTGDGTAQNPYKTRTKASSVATAGDNIMCDEGIHEDNRTLNSRAFNWWGNGKTVFDGRATAWTMYLWDTYNFISEAYMPTWGFGNQITYSDCGKVTLITTTNQYANFINCVVDNFKPVASTSFPLKLHNSIFLNMTASSMYSDSSTGVRNCIFQGVAPTIQAASTNIDHNNYTTNSIPTTNGNNANSKNNASTGQTEADYFNNPAIGDYTATAGSANLGAGFNRQNIGFGLGLTLHATDPAFLPENGAVLRNVHLVSDRFELEHRGLFIQSATDTTVVLHSSASSVDDYYNGLVFAILDGAGEGIMREILDYDGATKTITVASLVETLDPTTFYSISGRITSGVKDFGEVFKIARNQLFGMFGFNTVSINKWTEYAAINPKVASFGLKHSITDSLSGVDYKEYGFNGELLSDGTYGDADDDNNQANNKMQWLRTIQFDAPILIDFPL